MHINMARAISKNNKTRKRERGSVPYEFLEFPLGNPHRCNWDALSKEVTKIQQLFFSTLSLRSFKDCKMDHGEFMTG